MYEYKILVLYTTSDNLIAQAEETLGDLSVDDWEIIHIASNEAAGIHTVFLKRESP